MITQCSRRLVLELGRARIARLKCHREDKANGKHSGYSETETTARINELSSFIDRIETETYSAYKRPFTTKATDRLSDNERERLYEQERDAEYTSED